MKTVKLNLLIYLISVTVTIINAASINIATHVLDTTKGGSAPNILVNLYKLKSDDNWQLISTE